MFKILKLILLSFLLGFCINVQGQTQLITNFPYEVSFRGTSAPTGVVTPNPTTNSRSFRNEGLRLTNLGGQFGAVALDGVSFNATNGINIEFEYSMYDGLPYTENGVSYYGDGISVFLYDASKTLSIGAIGAGLGYAYNRSYNGTVQAGLNGGYLGIGLDEFGNFNGRRYNGGSRVNGVIPPTGWQQSSQVTLRGAMHPDGLLSLGRGNRGLRYSGYPVLITRTTRHSTSANAVHGVSLNATTGSYTNLGSIGSANAFQLRPGTLSTVKEDQYYRKAYITLLPHSAGGFRVTVRIQYNTSIVTVVDNYHYQTSLTYEENANGSNITTDNVERQMSGSTNWNTPYTPTTHTMSATVPEQFKIGFAGATGGAYQTQLIRDLVVSIPYMPETKEDINNNLCMAYSQQSININPFTNDKFYNGALTGTPTSGNDGTYIDFNSIQFSDANDNVLGNIGVGDKTYVQTGVGTWRSSGTTGLISFTPAIGYIGTATIYYTAKGTASQGGPFNQEIYRSVPQKISVNVVRCGGVINPQIPSGGVSRSGK